LSSGRSAAEWWQLMLTAACSSAVAKPVECSPKSVAALVIAWSMRLLSENGARKGVVSW
jgi:hypothetical protein